MVVNVKNTRYNKKRKIIIKMVLTVNLKIYPYSYMDSLFFSEYLSQDPGQTRWQKKKNGS